MIGIVLGNRYEILEEIGKGGMAHVYKAKCNLLNRPVAIKVLRQDLEEDREFLKRFNTEAQSAASTNVKMYRGLGVLVGIFIVILLF